MKRGLWAAGVLALAAGWGLMAATEAQDEKTADPPKADTPKASTKPAAACPTCAAKIGALLAVEQHCPIFPLYPIDDSNWLYYCDGYNNGCGFEEATTAEGNLDWPYIDCGYPPCISGNFARNASEPVSKHRFFGYPPPHLPKAATEWHFVHPDAANRFAVPRAYPVGGKDYIRVQNAPGPAGPANNTYYFKTFRVALEKYMALPSENRFRLIGIEISATDVGSIGGTETLDLRFGDAEAVRSIRNHTHVFKVVKDGDTSRDPIILIRHSRN